MTTLLTPWNSNSNAITCSDMLKILFFTDTWTSYFIASPGRTLSAGTLGLPAFGPLNEIQHLMITMSMSVNHIYTSLWHHCTILSWQKEIFQKYINFTSKFIDIISSIYEMMLNLWIYYIIFWFMSPTSRLELTLLMFFVDFLFISCCLSEDPSWKLHLLFEFFHCTLKQM